MKSLSYEEQNDKSTTRGAQFVPFRIQYYIGDTIRRHKHSEKTSLYRLWSVEVNCQFHNDRFICLFIS